MATKKAYEATNLQQVTSDAITSGNKKLEDMLDKAWFICMDYDKYCEWSDNDTSATLDTLREVGENELAESIANELAGIYGDDEVEVIDNWQDASWGYDW